MEVERLHLHKAQLQPFPHGNHQRPIASVTDRKRAEEGHGFFRGGGVADGVSIKTCEPFGLPGKFRFGL